MLQTECEGLNTETTPHHFSSDLCGGAEMKCCLSGSDRPAGFEPASLEELVDIPPTVNGELVCPDVTFHKTVLGDPGVECTTDKCLDCCESKSSITNANLVDMDVGPFNLRVFRPFGEVVKLVFADILLARPELFWHVKSAGAFCCRPTKFNSDAVVGTYSNHAWGTAFDLFFGADSAVLDDEKTQRGLLDIAAFFNKRNIFWGAGFRKEDSMHFQASEQLLVEWGCSGAYESSGFAAVENQIGGVQCPDANPAKEEIEDVNAEDANADGDVAQQSVQERGAEIEPLQESPAAEAGAV